MDTYEKKYKNALTIAQSRFKIEKDESVLTCLGMMFPELRESEDERVRRCIGMALTDVDEQRFKDFGTTLKDCLAWLEKQKPAEWHPEDEQNLNVCLSYIKDELLRSWLKDAIHVRYDKPAWNEEDEKMFWAVVDKLPACKERRWLIIRFHSIDIEKKKSWKPSEDEESKK